MASRTGTPRATGDDQRFTRDTSRGAGADSIDDATGPAATEARAGEKPGLFAALKLAFKNFREHNMTDRGAALTYFLVMSFFPALLVGISLLGFFGAQSTVTDSVGYLRDAGAPSEIVGVVESSLTNLISQSSGKALLPLILGILLGLNAASGAFGAAGRALNVAFDEDEDRGFVKKKGTQLFFTAIVIVLALISLVSVLLGGGVAKSLFGYIGLGETAGTIWTFARWPVALLSTMLIFGIIYAFAPDIRNEKFKFISPGAVAGVLVWIVASALFFLYVRNFSNYSATYGSFATPVILLLWLYVTSLAFLFGGELNAVYERLLHGKPKTKTVEAGEEA
jgi:membrane protein